MNPNWDDVMKFDLGYSPIIFDVGGYKGEFTDRCLRKYTNPFIYVFEPAENYYKNLIDKFQRNVSVYIFNLGISDKEQSAYLYGENDEITMINEGKTTMDMRAVGCFKELDRIMYKCMVTKIDLLKFNIEGAEYKVLEYLIRHDLLCCFKNILVQFHKNVPNYEKRRDAIQEKLSETHTQIFNYDFVFEGWQIKK
jgi:FkbM family methyltransferase